MSKLILTVIGIVLLVVGLAWLNWHNAPMREIERSSAALAKARSWHLHTARFLPGSGPETREEDIVCPSFRYTAVTGPGPDGTPVFREGIDYMGQQYYHAADQWMLYKGTPTGGLFECERGPQALDENSAPLASLLQDGTVRRGSLQDVENDSCREYEISFPTPRDPQEKEFRFFMCINEDDHLPRRTRRTQPGSDHEGVSLFSQWNKLTEPPLPAGFPKS
jgi:hypothetical protein